MMRFEPRLHIDAETAGLIESTTTPLLASPTVIVTDAYPFPLAAEVVGGEVRVRAATGDELTAFLTVGNAPNQDDFEWPGDPALPAGREIEWQEKQDSEGQLARACYLWSGEVILNSGSGTSGPFYVHERAACAWAFATALAMPDRDMCQREGRVHRYKGHAVRLNVASFLGLASLKPALESSPENLRVLAEADPWKQLFALAAQHDAENDLSPCWLFEQGKNPVKIRRIVPYLNHNREAESWPRLRATLATYRLVIGLPRQKDLLDALERNGITAEQAADWKIDLRPPSLARMIAPISAPAKVCRKGGCRTQQFRSQSFDTRNWRTYGLLTGRCARRSTGAGYCPRRSKSCQFALGQLEPGKIS